MILSRCPIKPHTFNFIRETRGKRARLSSILRVFARTEGSKRRCTFSQTLMLEAYTRWSTNTRAEIRCVGRNRGVEGVPRSRVILISKSGRAYSVTGWITKRPPCWRRKRKLTETKPRQIDGIPRGMLRGQITRVLAIALASVAGRDKYCHVRSAGGERGRNRHLVSG